MSLLAYYLTKSLLLKEHANQEGGINLEMNIHTLLYVNIRYITNKDLLIAQGILPNILW